ncbi:hypothetical protein NMG60_11019586 [Bertholletia excelsa]
MLRSLLSPSVHSLSFPENSHSNTFSSPHPPRRLLRFRISHRENLRYLKTLGIIDAETKTHKAPSPETLRQIISTVDFFKSKGFHDPDFPRLAFLCPDLFSPSFSYARIESVFDFLASDVAASGEESRGLILRCPRLLCSSAEFCLKPTLNYLRELGLENLNSPTNLNAHLLNTRIEKLEKKIKFLRSVGFSHEESAKICARLPAIFGYSVETNLKPKTEFLVREMKRGSKELMEFPQYFGFSLGKKIMPRHMHLKQKNVRVPLKAMLLCSDKRFYSKWK